MFIYVGIAMGAMGLLSAWCLSVPPAGWEPSGWNPPTPVTTNPGKASRDYTFSEAIRTPQFWMLYVACFCGCFAGLMVIGHIAGHGRDQGLTAMQAATAVSTLAIFNAVTRILIGAIADKIGTKTSFLTFRIFMTKLALK